MKDISKSDVALRDVFYFLKQGLGKKNSWLSVLMLVLFSVANVVAVFVPLQYKEFFDLLTGEGSRGSSVSNLVHIIIVIAILNGGAWLLFRIGFFIDAHVVSFTNARLKEITFNYIIKHSYSFFANNFSGSLIQKVNRFSRAFERLADIVVFSFVPLVIYVVGVLIILWSQSKTITLLVILWIILIFISSYIFSKWRIKYDLISVAADTETTGLLSDVITNQSSVMSFSQFAHEAQSFKDSTLKQAVASRYAWNLFMLFEGVQTALLVGIEFFLFYYGIQFWQQGLITIGTFVLMQVYILGLANRLWDFSRIIRGFYESFSDSKETVELLKLPYEIQDIPRAKKISVTTGGITFSDVVFNFNETRTVIDTLNLTISGGEKVALIGHSGAGKSTLIKLLLRMYNVTSGTIEIDGQDIAKVTQDSLRENISFVPQDPSLFHRTLMENIRYGRQNATDEEVMQAAKLAHCHEFIEGLSLGYNTLVGERGIKLSGGERQRVAIARAILKNAPILVLDEATSSLDSESEALIQEALDVLMTGKTVIVIAHRLSTIRKMDRIVVIEDGGIAEQGTHDELLKRRGGIYKKLWKMQAGGFVVE